MTAKKRNPQDATLRNIRALQRAVKKLQEQMRALLKPVRSARGLTQSR